MHTKSSNFQLIVLVLCGFFVFLGIILFATGTLTPKTSAISHIEVWGTIPAQYFNEIVEQKITANQDSLKVTYTQKDPDTFNQNLVEALADGVGPDVMIIDQTQIVQNLNRIIPIPYSSFPLRTFKDTYIDEAGLFLNDSGVLAVPLMVDPLVMYWNKSHFVNAAVPTVPKYWDEFPELVKKLTIKDTGLNLMQSGVALGEYQNIDHAKDILSALMIQAGAPIVVIDQNKKFAPAISGNFNKSFVPSVVALTFFTDFANPNSASYSWNKSLPTSRDDFLAGDLSIYFGFASELTGLRAKNPNLNFDVASFPQVRDTDRQMTFGNIYGMAILKSSPNVVSAFTQIMTMTDAEAIKTLSIATNLPPVRRDVLAEGSNDAYMKIFYEAALRAFAWIDPNRRVTDSMFKNMIESVVRGQSRIDEGINRAQQEFEVILDQAQKNEK